MPTLSAKQREALKNWKPKIDPELERQRDAMTDEDITRAALEDPDCPPLSPETLKRIANRPGPTPPSFEERKRYALISAKANEEDLADAEGTQGGK